MARIFITGSADGLGQLSAKALIEQGHQVVLHARNAQRAREALKKKPGGSVRFNRRSVADPGNGSPGQ